VIVTVISNLARGWWPRIIVTMIRQPPR